MRRVFIALLLAGMAAPTAAEETDPAIKAAELATKQANADAARFEAEEKKYKAQLAAAEAKFGFLPKSPATEGKVTLGEGSGKLESTLMMAAALEKAAGLIQANFKNDKDLLLVAGDGSLDNGKYIAFKIEAFGIEDAMTTALGVPVTPGSCEPGASGNHVPFFMEVFGSDAGALVSALSGMLRSDVEVRNVGESVTSDHLLRAVLARGTPGQFILPQQNPAEAVSKKNPVVKTLCRLGFGRGEIEGKLSKFGDKPTDAEKRKKAQLTLTAARYDDWLGRLTKSEDGAVPALGAIYMQSSLFARGTNVLRVWVEKSGGTLLTRRNLWTTLGAPAVGVTGGIVVSYAKFNAETGAVEKAGFMHCNTELASLRRVHASRAVRSDCLPNN